MVWSIPSLGTISSLTQRRPTIEVRHLQRKVVHLRSLLLPKPVELLHHLRRPPRRVCNAGVVMRSFLLFLALILLPVQALAGPKEEIAALAPSGLVLVMDAQGKELIAQNADEPFVPASVTKIVTVWLAIQVLGGDYRFQTRFYLDAKRVLYVRGGGDPFLISEELARLATELVAAVGSKPITGIVLDES